MSAFGGKADIGGVGPLCLLIAISGHDYQGLTQLRFAGGGKVWPVTRYIPYPLTFAISGSLWAMPLWQSMQVFSLDVR